MAGFGLVYSIQLWFNASMSRLRLCIDKIKLSPAGAYGNTLTLRLFLRCWSAREFPWIKLNYLVSEVNT